MDIHQTYHAIKLAIYVKSAHGDEVNVNNYDKNRFLKFFSKAVVFRP